MSSAVPKPNEAKPRIQAVDLFCGVGGLAHGLRRGGIGIAAGIDLDDSCRFPFEVNNGAPFLQRDVGTLEPAELVALFGRADVRLLAGCAPCQPFSTYSRSGRGRAYDTQWPLISVFGRLIQQLQPELVTMENVPQLAFHPVFGEFLSSLDGYHVWRGMVECASIGIPQTRRRLVLIASRLGNEGLGIDSRFGGHSTVRDTIADLPSIPAGGTHPSDAMHTAPALSPLNRRRIRASTPGGTWRDWPVTLQAACHRRSTGATYPSVYGRMEWDHAAPTMTTQCFGYGNGRFGHPEQDRAISLREAAMLQTFPADYQFLEPGQLPKFNRMGRLIGNAVPVRLGEVIGLSIVQHVQATLSRGSPASGRGAKTVPPHDVVRGTA